jgi:hypothetical protein
VVRRRRRRKKKRREGGGERRRTGESEPPFKNIAFNGKHEKHLSTSKPTEKLYRCYSEHSVNVPTLTCAGARLGGGWEYTSGVRVFI